MNQELSKEQINSFRSNIETQLKQIKHQISVERQELLQSTENKPARLSDALDQVKEENDLKTQLRLHDRSMQLSDRLQLALHKISCGTFGYCGGCGENIEIARLASSPSASLCIWCQEATERKSASYAPFKWPQKIICAN